MDTNVLIDVLTDRPGFADASVAALTRCLTEGSLVVCDIVWTEIAASAGTGSAREWLKRMEIGFSVTVEPSADLAAEAWRRYRRDGGGRARLAPDFLIGGHALFQAERLLSRDRGFFRRYFEDLELLDPTE